MAEPQTPPFSLSIFTIEWNTHFNKKEVHSMSNDTMVTYNVHLWGPDSIKIVIQIRTEPGLDQGQMEEIMDILYPDAEFAYAEESKS